MEILAIIPARAGSKRVPRKNIKTLAHEPLINWTIKTALQVTLAHLLVSTDDNELAEIARSSGAEVPFMRAPEYASDTASVIDVVFEVLDYYEDSGKHFDGVLLLQPTSPFRSAATIQAAIDRFDGSESVVSVSPARTHPAWCKIVKDETLIPFDDSFDPNLRSQNLPEVYELNGSIYLASVETLRAKRSFYSDNTKALIIDSEEEALDIDTPFDWVVAESIAKARRQAS